MGMSTPYIVTMDICVFLLCEFKYLTLIDLLNSNIVYGKSIYIDINNLLITYY